MQRYRELEETFEVDPGFAISSIAGKLSGHGAHLEPPRRATLRATYFDTADLRLLRNGITLRRRTGGSDEGWHLKLPGSRPGDRLELRLPLGAGRSAVPSEHVELLTAYLRGEQPRPVLTIDTDRTASVVREEGGDPVAEVADDRVVAERLSDHEVRAWREVEVERLGERSAAARVLRKLLLQAGARPARTASKAARAMGLAPGSRPGGEPAEGRREGDLDLLAGRLHHLAAELARQDLELRQGRDEALHDLRVAVRRLRSLLRTFAPLFEPAPAAALRGELGWLSGVLGDARDKEVLADRAAHDLDGVPGEECLGPIRAELAGTLRAASDAAHADLLGVLRQPRYRELLTLLAGFAERPPYRPGRCGKDSALLRRNVRREVARAIRRVEAAHQASPGGEEAAFHEARKVAKRVRYAAETVVPLAPGPARRLAARFEAVQEALGERHDAAVARECYTREGAAAGGRPGENGYTYGVIAERERRAIADAAAEFEAAWRRAERPSLRRFLR